VWRSTRISSRRRPARSVAVALAVEFVAPPALQAGGFAVVADAVSVSALKPSS
jgi:hypothetical protein